MSSEGITKVYRGFLRWISNGWEDDLVVLIYPNVRQDQSHLWDNEDGPPLAKRLQEDVERHGHFLTVRYFVTDEEKTADELTEAHVRYLFGDGKVGYEVHYSEFTGYLWTDEDIQVGGHDLLAELKSHVGKFCHLEIVYHKEPSANVAG